MGDKQPVEVAKNHYELLDEGQYDDMFELYDESIVYDRPGQGTIDGIEEFRQFYLEDRPLEHGTHEVTWVIADDGDVAIQGTYRGVQNDAPISFDFADFFQITEPGVITRRWTYISVLSAV